MFTAMGITAAIVVGYLFRDWFAINVMPPPSRMQAETTQAYRYAKMISSDGHIPSTDSLVMHPEGFRTSENSIFEEYIAGGIHRLVGGDFDSFMRTFCLLFPLLVIPFLYLWMRAAGIGEWNSAAAASLYAFLYPALLRARGGSLYRETVALPILVALGWLTERSLQGRDGDGKPAWGIMAGLVLFLALAAWKVTGFLCLFLFIYLLWRNWKDQDVPYVLRVSLAAAQIIGSVLLTHMRHDGAYMGPATVLAVFLLLRGTRGIWFPITACVIASATVFLGESSTGHVSAVVMAKLRFLFRHPSDPSMLSDDARLFWVPGYTSPTPAQLLLLFGIPAAAALPGIRKFLGDYRHKLVFWFLIVSLAGYLFFDRLMIFLAIALVPVIALSIRRVWILVPVAILILLQSVFPASMAKAVSATGLEFRNTSSLLNDRELDSFLNWMKYSTDSDQAVLSYWHISGLISAYAQRPVVTHTFFENSHNRRTIIDFARHIFMPEDSLVRFMRAHDCDLLVYQADFLLDRSSSGILYLAGLTSVPENSVAQDLQYHPENLDSLVPVFQGPSLRVFSLDTRDAPDLPRQFLFQERYRHCYNGYEDAVGIISDMRGWSGYLADKAVDSGDMDMLSGALLLGLQGAGPADVTESMLNRLIQWYIQGDYDLDRLTEDIDSFTYWNGERPDLRLLLARFYAAEGRLREAAGQYRMVLTEDPGNTDASAELQMVLEDLNNDTLPGAGERSGENE